MRVVVALLLLALPSCAGVAGAVASECAAAMLQGVAEVCCDAAIGALCEDGDLDSDDDDDDAVAEVPPPPPREPLPDVPPCATRALAGGVWRLDCVDGTIAEAITDDSDDGEDGEDGDGLHRLTGLRGVERLAGRRSVAGSVHIGGPALLRVELPSLRHVDGDLVIEQTTQLSTLRLPALARVGGALRLLRNRALRGDPCPALAHAAVVDVAFNDALPPAVVDRLLALAPPPPVDNGG